LWNRLTIISSHSNYGFTIISAEVCRAASLPLVAHFAQNILSSWRLEFFLSEDDVFRNLWMAGGVLHAIWLTWNSTFISFEILNATRKSSMPTNSEFRCYIASTTFL
ncbi:unnamed protein product, partial [Prunus brigantina]